MKIKPTINSCPIDKISFAFCCVKVIKSISIEMEGRSTEH